MKKNNLTFESLASLKARLGDLGCRRLLIKALAPNDNSKNQIYLGPDFSVLNMIPAGDLEAADHSKDRFYSHLQLYWLAEDGTPTLAPHAKLILYPQYPEVRLSGVLAHCSAAPSHIIASRSEGRFLILGVGESEKIVAVAVEPDSKVSSEISLLPLEELSPNGVLSSLEIFGNARQRLLSKLGDVADQGWIDSIQLSQDGTITACKSSNCGGYTLEAKLGIPKNSNSGPDFYGWEVKQHGVRNLAKPSVGNPITLMTPEPDGGFYIEAGIEDFIRRFGAADRNGVIDRLNFGGVHKVRHRSPRTGLTLHLVGYDRDAHQITNNNGALYLADDKGFVAASWQFSSLLTHWAKKHDQAAFVPSIRRTNPSRQYRFGHHVRLCSGADSRLFLKGLSEGTIYYDPGIKLENASTDARMKRRNQFRVTPGKLESLYARTEHVSL